MMVLNSVEDECMFSTTTIIKMKLHNRLHARLLLVVGMHAQALKNFPYELACYDWRKERHCDDIDVIFCCCFDFS